MRSSTTVLAFCFLATAYASIGPVADVNVANRDIAPDGFSRPAVLVGGTFPGPAITGFKGDHFKLNVVNSLTEESMLRTTSIHWHGIFLNGSSWADGPVGVTQCPITPGDSFLYEFTIPDQAGTFWYHSHHSTQYCDGLRGPLIVYDANDPYASLYDVDDDNTIITLSDWYHTIARQSLRFPTADSTLINGKGRYALGPPSDLAVINVSAGTRYRFRLISMSCDPSFTFSIDGHTMTIIEVDGVNSQPVKVDSIEIFAGQRYSFVLEADQPVNNYWIRANPGLGSRGFFGGINSAILRYKGALIQDPTTAFQSSQQPLLETNLHPLENPGAPGLPMPGGVDDAINISMGIDLLKLAFTMNGVSFTPPPLPVLLQIISGKASAQDLLPEGSVYTLPPNKVIELTIPGGVLGGPHPFHLHGHNFDVVRSAGSSQYNYVNPVRRDVVSIGSFGDNVTIRFTTDNSGPWILHCHIDWHLEAGMAVVFAEDVRTIHDSRQPDSWHDLCPKYEDFGEL